MRADEIVTKILELRGIKDTQEFFNPTHPSTIISPFDSQPAIDLIKKHVTLGNKIAVYGDYDVDGICGTAILWETIYANYKNVFPTSLTGNQKVTDYRSKASIIAYPKELS